MSPKGGLPVGREIGWRASPDSTHEVGRFPGGSRTPEGRFLLQGKPSNLRAVNATSTVSLTFPVTE